MFICLRCDTKFDEPDINETWDAYDAHGSYAVSYFEQEACPSCGSESIDECEEECEFEDE